MEYHKLSQSTMELKRICFVCGNCKLPVKQCTQCKNVSYCSKKCQKKDWLSGHKQLCQSPTYQGPVAPRLSEPILSILCLRGMIDGLIILDKKKTGNVVFIYQIDKEENLCVRFLYRTKDKQPAHLRNAIVSNLYYIVRSYGKGIKTDIQGLLSHPTDIKASVG